MVEIIVRKRIMHRATQFSMTRLLGAVALMNLACCFLSDFVCGTLRSLVDGPALLACVAAALACLIGNVRQTCFVALAVFALVPLGVGSLWLLFLLILGC